MYTMIAFNITELAFMEQIVRSYLRHEETAEIRDSILLKLKDEREMLDISSGIMQVAQSLEEHPGIKIVFLGDNSEEVPIFRFLECPAVLNSAVFFSLPPDHRYSPVFSVTETGIVISNNSTSSRTSVHLGMRAIEILLAFIVYHKLKKRGISYSGSKAGKENERDEEKTETQED